LRRVRAPSPTRRSRREDDVLGADRGGQTAPRTQEHQERDERLGMRITELPTTRQAIYALERACLKEAKAAGYRGSHAVTEANRRYFDAIDECKRKVREPQLLPSVLHVPLALPA